MSVAEATAALEEAEAAHVRALAEASEARAAFEQKPTAESHSDVAVKERIALNAAAALELAKKTLAEADRDDVRGQIRDADTRASHVALWAALEPEFAHLFEMSDELLDTFARVRRKVSGQNRASREGAELRARQPDGENAPAIVPLTLVRAVVGLRLYRRILATGQRFAVGLEPWAFLRPRWSRGHGAPDAAEMIHAQKIAFPDGLQLPVTSFRADTADRAPFHEKTSGTPSRHEV
jgi:hypothetical protein